MPFVDNIVSISDLLLTSRSWKSYRRLEDDDIKYAVNN